MEKRMDGDVLRISCVILNYNDPDTVERLVSRIRSYDCFQEIILVDNASTDGSLKRLSALADEKVKVVSAEKNGGYGAGNNLGVAYAAGNGESFWEEEPGAVKSRADYVLIANPDVSFQPDCVIHLAEFLSRNRKAGAVSAVMEDRTYPDLKNAWPLRSFFGELLAMGPVSRRLFRRFLEYPKGYFKGKTAVLAGALHGSMLMVRAEAFREAGGYDEGMFLYQEEAVLALRMRRAGYESALLLSDHYLHEHSASIGKSVQSQMRRQRLREESVLYYMKRYLSIGPVRELAARAWFFVIRVEIRAAVWLRSFVKT